jgi:HK97 family phage major capsid protein
MSESRKSERRPEPKTLYRQMVLHVDRAELEQRAFSSDDRIPIAISSEVPVLRSDIFGDRYNEILDHSPEAVDLSYAKDGLPFLADHDTRTQLGIVEGVSIGKDRILRGVVRFSQRQAAAELRRDMMDGIRKKISVGYRVIEITSTVSPNDDAPDEVRVTKWQPLEASSVAIPADYGVGVGRSLGDPSPVDRHSPATIKLKRRPMKGKQTEEDREGIRALIADHPDLKPQLDVMSVRGDTYEEAAKFALEELRRRLPKPTAISLDDGYLDVGHREARGEQFSLRRFIAGEAGEKVDNGRDLEIIQEYMRKTGRRAARGGYVLPIDLRELTTRPRDIATRAAMTTTGTAAPAVFPQYSGDFDILRNQPMVVQMGATNYPGNVGNVAFVKQTGDASAVWTGEAPGADVADQALAFTQVTGTPKSLQAMTLLSKLTLVQTTPQMEEKVRTSIAAQHGLAIDQAAINGAGSATVPKGILNVAGIGVVALGANGGNADYNSLVDLESAVAVPNALLGRLGYMTTPGQRGKLRKIAQLANTANVPVWTGGLAGEINNSYPAVATKQIPSNLVKGTSGAVCHAIIFGNWADLYICEWGTFEILVDPYTLAGRGIVRVISYQAVDVIVAHPESFSAIVDALP